MSFSTARRCTGAAALAAALLGGLPVQAAEEAPRVAGSGAISAAEQQIFMAPHLRGLRSGTVLRYAFVHGGSMETGYQGPLELQLRAGADGRCCDAGATSFPEAQGPRPLPTVEGASSNPVILYFLEHDLREMQRLTRGQMNHFRRRIRLALAEDARSDDVRVRYQGRELSAQRLQVSPYLDDPMRSRFEQYAAKRYEFVLADVPGGVVQLRTQLPAGQPGAQPLLEETLTLEGAEVSAATAKP
ncbi:hypothetical protein [Azohydromonas caseinilytica]|uniref:DUF3108 domain-containing protein n=1 Tax=Azohydromonas caseinilytica TaxID=2728836 RepID=A0A848FBX1_9BURK|nr:hypothetical protein [Azohydromonas caseinilytica]NML15813.1 hypothetical protein [Azohydromonas caseinilytica]